MERPRLAEEYRGVRFRQIAPNLRWPVGEGLGTQHLSKRPRDPRTLAFLDGEDGTIIEFEDGARVDVDQLLARGWIVRADPAGKAKKAPAEPAAPVETEAASGKTS